MPFTISFENTLEYVMGIGALRAEANQHTQHNPQQVTVTYHKQSVTLIVNLAYKPSKPAKIEGERGKMIDNPDACSGLAGSLYVLGFVQKGVNYVLDDQDVQLGSGLNFGGAYKDLGDPGIIGLTDIVAAIGAISGYNGVAKDGFKRNLAILVICISEAIRFHSVQGAIGNVLSGGVYAADMGKYKSWDNAKLGNS